MYLHYINIEGGLIILIINKYKFNWNCINRFVYDEYTEKIEAFFSFGRFTLDKDLSIYCLDEKFQKLMELINYSNSCLDLNKIEKIIEDIKSTQNFNFIKTEEKVKEKEVELEKVQRKDSPIILLLKQNGLNNNDSLNNYGESNISFLDEKQNLYEAQNVEELRHHLFSNRGSPYENKRYIVMIGNKIMAGDNSHYHRIEDEIRWAMKNGKHIKIREYE